MNYLFIIFLLITTLGAEQKKQTLTVGLGVYTKTQPYIGVDDLVLPSPVIFYDNGIFYVRWSRVGLYFLGEKTDAYAWGFSLTALPRTYGYEASNELALFGLDDIETSWEGGLAFGATMGKSYVEILLVTDILDSKEKSWVLKTEVGYDLKFGEFLIYPSFVVEYQSKEFLNYYYGVSSKQTLSADIQLGVQTFIKYPLTKQLSTLIHIKAEKLPQEATNSPIIQDDYIYSGLLSLIYTIEF